MAWSPFFPFLLLSSPLLSLNLRAKPEKKTWELGFFSLMKWKGRNVIWNILFNVPSVSSSSSSSSHEELAQTSMFIIFICVKELIMYCSTGTLSSNNGIKISIKKRTDNFPLPYLPC
jgi:hypothetical protein